MNWDALKPGYTVVLDTEAKQRLWTKVLIAKIVVQVILIALLLALGGWTWLQIVGVVTVATAWQYLSRRPAVKASPVLEALVIVAALGAFLALAFCMAPAS